MRHSADDRPDERAIAQFVPLGPCMKLEIEIGGRTQRVELNRIGTRVEAFIDGRKVDAEAADLSDGAYSILIDGRSFDVRVQQHGMVIRAISGGHEFAAIVRDPRKLRRGTDAFSAEGPQSVTAPMPGKVVRVLVKEGDHVDADQGLLVVEAMKMQNEVRSPKSGTVQALRAAEGQAVNSSEVLAVVA